MASTKEIVEAHTKVISEKNEEKLEHLQKLNLVLPRSRTLTDSVNTAVISKALEEIGFSLIVDPVIISKFKFHATIHTTWNCDGVLRKHGIFSDRIYFSGDIPDFAIDRISKAKKLFEGLDGSCISIHSNEPLPIEYTRLSDPVVLGWVGLDSIKVGKKISITSFEPYGSRLPPPLLCFVIAIWNEEGKEI